MTKDLVNKLIAHYEGVIAQIEGMENVDRMHQLLFETHTRFGVCSCASEVFKAEIYEDAWVNSFRSRIWFAYPKWLHTQSEILEALQFRVDRLKTFNE